MLNREEVINYLKGLNNDISFRVVTKNNGVKKLACIIPSEKDGNKFSAVVYIDDILKRVKSLDHVKMVYEAAIKAVTDISFNRIESIIDRDYILNNSFVQLINREMNEEILANAVWRPFLDLAIVARVKCFKTDSAINSTIITKDICSLLGLDHDELINTALKEVKEADDFRVFSMAELLGGPSSSNNTLLKTASRLNHPNGATVLLRTDILKDLADRLNSDLMIAGSSTDEIMIFPYGRGIDEKDFLDILRDVNNDENAVEKDKILTNNLYHFDRNTSTLSIVEG